jgi:hypothetical protein
MIKSKLFSIDIVTKLNAYAFNAFPYGMVCRDWLNGGSKANERQENEAEFARHDCRISHFSLEQWISMMKLWREELGSSGRPFRLIVPQFHCAAPTAGVSRRSMAIWAGGSSRGARLSLWSLAKMYL